MTNKSNNTKAAWLGYTIIVVILFICVELISAFIIFQYPRTSKLFYSPLELDQEKFQDYLKVRDPLLGWPATNKIGSDQYDKFGARPDPSYPEHSNTCVSTYGDSFTYGDEVSNQAAWGHQLTKRLSCRVANFGVSAYGTDQALLRYKNNPNDQAPIVLLGIYQENILRIVNQYRYFLSHGDLLSFKPRFVIENDSLKVVKLPVSVQGDLRTALNHPREYFKHEWFLPGSNDGPAYISFPYTISVINALLSKRVQNGLLGKPNWLEFYSPTHPSNAFALMDKIIEEFAGVAKSRNVKFKIILFPSTVGYLFWEKSGENPIKTLTSLIERNGYDYIDLTPKFSENLKGGDYCDLLTNQGRHCSGHYNDAGNLLVSDIIFEWLRNNSK